MRSEALATGASNDDQVVPPLPSAERLQILMFEAARLGRVDMIPALLQAGADISATDSRGYTPLILASYNDHPEAMSLLLKCGANIDQPDLPRGNTALMGASFKGYAGIVDILLQAGASVSVQNRAGQTALMFASMFGHCEIVDQLLQYGADPFAADAALNTAVTVAASQGNDLMVARLKSHASS